jgi:hypothetical protein
MAGWLLARGVGYGGTGVHRRVPHASVHGVLRQGRPAFFLRGHAYNHVRMKVPVDPLGFP